MGLFKECFCASIGAYIVVTSPIISSGSRVNEIVTWLGSCQLHYFNVIVIDDRPSLYSNHPSNWTMLFTNPQTGFSVADAALLKSHLR